MRRIAACIVLVVLPLAEAQASPAVGRGGKTGEIEITDSRDGTAKSGRGGVRRARPVYVYVTLEWIEGTNRFCARRHVTSDPERAADHDYVTARRGAEANGGVGAGLCPAEVRTRPVPGPAVLAASFWDVRQLPAPVLRAAPGWAMAGRTVYLEIGGQRVKRFDVPNPIGPAVTIEAASSYVVDWGDGTATVTESQGGPWPEGDVTHVYGDARPSLVITVRQRWTATWSAGAESGVLEGLETVGTLPFRVEQVQAVRNR